MTRSIITAAVTVTALFAGASTAWLQTPAPTAGQNSPAPADPTGRGRGAAGQGVGAPADVAGQGRGRGGLIQEYPADPNTVIQTLHGFKIEVVAKADRLTQGSWISIAEDDRGRLILGANEQQPFTRLTLNAAGQVTRTETIFTPVSEAMGMLWHNGGLYVQGGRLPEKFTQVMENPGFGRQSGQAGLHFLTDPSGDGSFSSVETFRTWDGDEGGHSDHGVHEPKVSPDGKHLYIINGNGVVPPPDVLSNSPLRHYGEDRILPLLANQSRRLAPSGFIARTDFKGQQPQLFAGGFRNALHFAWNADGEIFSFDSDHEPELGVPWYRPTRVFWAPSGADMGHREGSGKYPTWYEDVMAPLVEVGLASPVGVTFGYTTRFPAAYQKAFFVADNNYGRIIAVHLQPSGSGYVASSWENFVWPKAIDGISPSMPHNVTDMMVARDGTFYYVIGSRRAQSYVMKITYTGTQRTDRVEYRNTDGAEARALRRSLERFHWTTDDAAAVTAAWPHLGSQDRFVRYAARVALETVKADTWKARAVAETDPATAIVALLALARTGGPAANAEIFATLNRFPMATLSDRLRLQKLRVIQVAVSRYGKPSDAAAARVVADIDAVFPGSSYELNHDMSQVLAAFNAPTVAEKTMRLAAETRLYQEDFAYRYNLRLVTAGWTLDARRQYFQWFNEDHSNGPYRYDYREWFTRVGQQPRVAGNGGPMNQVRAASLATLTDPEKADPELAAILGAYQPPAAGRGGGRRGGGGGAGAPGAPGAPGGAGVPNTPPGPGGPGAGGRGTP